MFINYKSALGILESILKSWPLFAVLTFVAALAFQAGYMTLPLGASVFHVSVEDLSKSGLLIVLSLLILQTFILILNAIGFFSSKLIKIIVAIILLVIFLSSDLYSLVWLNQMHDPVAEFTTKITLFSKVLAAFLFAILYHQFKGKSEEVSLDLMGLFGIGALVLIYLFGLANFLTDTKSSKAAKIFYTDGSELAVVIIAERAEYYLSLLPSECTYVVSLKSAVKEVRLDKAQLSNFRLYEIGQCFK